MVSGRRALVSRNCPAAVGGTTECSPIAHGFAFVVQLGEVD